MIIECCLAKDVDIADNTLPDRIRSTQGKLVDVLGALGIIVVTIPVFAFVVLPALVAYFFLMRFFVSTTRQTKRLESVTRSPIYSHFGETMTGTTTITAFSREEDFVAENRARIEDNQRCYMASLVVGRWASVRLGVIGAFLVTAVALFTVYTRGSMNPGSIGLCLSYALNITDTLNILTRNFSEVETNLVSVERIAEYQEVVQEAPYTMEENSPPVSWPEHGVVKFDGYKARYREGLDLVLRGIDLTILSGEKVGIVGRTGAGKSSLTLALFRLVEPAAGSIYIDGVNIRHLGLGQLREGLTIIPQDPVLFSGSLRMNLDPVARYSDSQVWSALRMAHLGDMVEGLAAGLDHQVAEGGGNLSLGQRQLLCLARAILRRTQVLGSSFVRCHV